MKVTQADLSQRLNKNGWDWHLVSTVTPGIVRIQMGDDHEEETGWRKCVEAPTLQLALEKAEKLVNAISADDYCSRYAQDGDHV